MATKKSDRPVIESRSLTLARKSTPAVSILSRLKYP